MKNEYVIWGLTQDQSEELDEQPLYTKAESMEQAQSVMRILKAEYKCHSMRVQVIDGTIPDFTAALKG